MFTKTNPHIVEAYSEFYAGMEIYRHADHFWLAEYCFCRHNFRHAFQTYHLGRRAAGGRAVYRLSCYFIPFRGERGGSYFGI